MEAKQLIFFKRAAELEHMTKAAEELMVSQPFLSKTIAALEDELGVALFDHEGRRVVLNASGKAFYKRVVNIFNEAEDAKREVRNINLIQQTRLTIVTNVSQFMPGMLEMISAANPEIIIRQLSAGKRDIIRMLHNGEVDFALCSPPINERAEFESIQLRHEEAVIIAPENHWLKERRTTSFSELKNEVFVSVAQGYGARDAFDYYFSQLGVTPNIVIETADTSSIFRYVEKGLGIAAVPLSTVLQEPAFKESYAVMRNGEGGDIALAWRRNQNISNAGRQFIKTSQDFFSRLEDFVNKNRLDDR